MACDSAVTVHDSSDRHFRRLSHRILFGMSKITVYCDSAILALPLYFSVSTSLQSAGYITLMFLCLLLSSVFVSYISYCSHSLCINIIYLHRSVYIQQLKKKKNYYDLYTIVSVCVRLKYMCTIICISIHLDFSHGAPKS